MPRCRLLLLLLLSYLTTAAVINDKSNLTKLDCTYKDGRFGRIDLSRVGLKRGIPAFRHVLKDDYFYSFVFLAINLLDRDIFCLSFRYNPCYPFSEGNPCVDVAICQSRSPDEKNFESTYFVCLVSKDAEITYVLGTNARVSWSVSPSGSATLVYSTEDRQTLVNLVCADQIDQLEINNEYELKHYNLTLLSRCACWNGC
jgi:hypothetical protein